MAQILVPGVAQATFNGLYLAQPWAVVTHWKYDGQTQDWTAANIQTLATELKNGWANNLATFHVSQVVLQNVQTVDLGNSAPVTGQELNGVSGTHPSTGGLPSSTCFVVSDRIGARYRGGHPRQYLPIGTPSDTNSESTWSPTFVSNATAGWVGLVNHVRSVLPPVNGSQLSQVSIAYTYTYENVPTKNKYVKVRTGLKNVYVVQSYIGRSLIGTQRRRLVAG
jgi:hypothetical protein